MAALQIVKKLDAKARRKKNIINFFVVCDINLSLSVTSLAMLNDHRALLFLLYKYSKKVLMLSIVNYNQPNRDFGDFYLCIVRIISLK